MDDALRNSAAVNQVQLVFLLVEGVAVAALLILFMVSPLGIGRHRAVPAAAVHMGAGLGTHVRHGQARWLTRP